jgi:hypothetical protein
VTHNWTLFEGLLAYGPSGSKDKRTQWIADVSQMRNIVMHPTRQQHLSMEQLTLLETYSTWLERSVRAEQQ